MRDMSNDPFTKNEILYSDTLVAITNDEITFKHYYFPTGRLKIARLSDVASVTVEPPTIWNGKWRLWGTGNFKTWYPRDNRRHKRDRIFFATLNNQWGDIGFTVEDGERVEKILKDKNLLKQTTRRQVRSI